MAQITRHSIYASSKIERGSNWKKNVCVSAYVFAQCTLYTFVLYYSLTFNVFWFVIAFKYVHKCMLFFDLVFCLVWFGLTVYKITCDLVIRIVQFVMNTEYETRISNSVYACALMSMYFQYMVNYARKSTTDMPDNVDDCVYLQNGKWRTKWHVIWSKHQIWSYLLYQKRNRTVCTLLIVQGMHPCKTDNTAALFTSLVLSCTASSILRSLEDIASTNH